jgi:osmotically-inducible protein OsmY
MRHEQEVDADRRPARDRGPRTGEAASIARPAEPRSWISRARDEIASWFGDAGAPRRRQGHEGSGGHAGEGPTRIIDADTVIVEMLNHRLRADPELEASNIKVSCDGRVVTLEGFTRTSAAARRAEGLAGAVGGVERVINRLQLA